MGALTPHGSVFRASVYKFKMESRFRVDAQSIPMEPFLLGWCQASLRVSGEAPLLIKGAVAAICLLSFKPIRGLEWKEANPPFIFSLFCFSYSAFSLVSDPEGHW